MGGDALELGCKCGQVRIALDAAGARAATRLRCYCKDCQAAARHLGYDLPGHAGTELIQTTPDHLRIVQGQENLEILRLSPKGLCRWYATCCGTPMMNSLPKRGLPFAGLVVHEGEQDAVQRSVGKLRGHAFTKYAPKGRGAPARDVNYNGIGLGIIRRMLGAFLSGRFRRNALLGADGGWIAPVRVLSLEKRRAATPPAP
ncbi:DUF6151 family protein [Thalassobius sp. S69A]|uniref:DUF6151 family protein n=1 Tax=unclassified Thalassovita TaxID=2619711 RepID=UPI000C0CF35E|nr:hypothetical protein [Paracoccaceae bacterium]MBT25351.1 hypothetical protein [Paracoccaceae bacterium]